MWEVEDRNGDGGVDVDVDGADGDRAVRRSVSKRRKAGILVRRVCRRRRAVRMGRISWTSG